MKSLLVILSLLSLLVFVSSDIKIRRKRSVENEGEKHEEILIKNDQNVTTHIDIDVDQRGRDFMKLFFDESPFRSASRYPTFPDVRMDVDGFFSQMKQIGDTMKTYFDTKATDLPVIANDTRTEVIEDGNQKMLKTTSVLTRGNNETMVVMTSVSYEPLNSSEPDPNEYEISTQNNRR